MSQPQPQAMDDTADKTRRSRSNTTTSAKERLRPKSRGSTTSLQSVGVGTAFQPSQPMPMDQNAMYPMQAHPGPQMMYGHNAEEAYPHYQPGMAHVQQPPMMERQPGMSQQEIRPMSQHGFQEVQPYPVNYSNGMPQYPVQHQQIHHMRHPSEHYEGSPAPEDSSNENGGARRKKGNATSMANDQELRRLLQQYSGKTLVEVAQEVQKSEGSGGKSEKAKQVFAMLWLQDSCQRSNNSVRRDRVFARYTERCANERVPTLNPASFGKLVRIIFPNVQTRRLGVRGESKYHYVDLSLVPDDDDRNYISTFDPPSTVTGIRSRRNSTVEAEGPLQEQAASHPEQPSSRKTMETADFPTPSASFLAKDTEPEQETSNPEKTQASTKLDCHYRNTATIRIPHKGLAYNLVDALPCVRPSLPASLSTYVAMPTLNSLSQLAPSSQDAPIELPDIHPYLAGKDYDASLARSLYHLYRSYCIDVIDAFRKCKEKPFFNHHSAFNGKMTVPVSKLFNMECLGPWIQECDMRMYKQLVKFIAPLALQNVPDVVFGVFERISGRLVNHLIIAFEEKCPVHVVVAKVVPAARFTNVLKKLRGVNEATLQMNRMLDDAQQRTQMWLDLMSMIDPDRLLDDSVPPPECYANIQGVLKHDLRTLVDPLDTPLTTQAEDDQTSPYANFLNEATSEPGVLSLEVLDQPIGLLEKWISWLECLPQAFDGHHPQCMIDWHTKFWRSLMTQAGQGGAHSYQSWWIVEAFATQALGWMAEMQGMLLPEEEQKAADEREQEKKSRDVSSGVARQGEKRKRTDEDDDEFERPAKKPDLSVNPTPVLKPTPPMNHPAGSTATNEPQEPTLPEMPQHHDDEDTDAEMDELRRGGPLDLPSFPTGMTSPIKKALQQAPHLQHLAPGVGDDSGIDLGMDVDAEAEKEAKKFNKRDWFLSSDPVEQGHVGVLA